MLLMKRDLSPGWIKNWLASLKDLRSNSMLSLFKMTTTTDKIRNGIVAFIRGCDN
jgi:hypothetical protein